MTTYDALASFENERTQRREGPRTARAALALSGLSLLGTAALGVVLVAPQHLPMQLASSALDGRLRSTNEQLQKVTVRLDGISAELEQLRQSREEQSKTVGLLRQEIESLRNSAATVSSPPTPARRGSPARRR